MGRQTDRQTVGYIDVKSEQAGRKEENVRVRARGKKTDGERGSEGNKR